MVKVLIMSEDNEGILHFIMKFYVFKNKEINPFIQKCWYNTESKKFSQRTTNLSRDTLDKMLEFYKEAV